MRENGFTVEEKGVQNLNAVKDHFGVPGELSGCHTAIVDGYIIEGHVPAADVKRLLEERPAVRGLAVPGMPVGSPGMESPGVSSQPYSVLTFDDAGNTAVYATYP